MEVIEKETIKEVPVDCNGNRVCGGWGYGYGPYANEAIRGNFASKGVAGAGHIKLNLPFTNKRLVLNMDDLEAFKEMLITKK